MTALCSGIKIYLTQTQLVLINLLIYHFVCETVDESFAAAGLHKIVANAWELSGIGQYKKIT